MHAESESVTSALAERALYEGRSGVRDYLESRPVVAEQQAIARDDGDASPGRDMDDMQRAAGVDVTCETCPHYLVLTEDDMEELGAVAKCAPPLRNAEDQASL